MRVLLISDFYPPYRGGMEQHFRPLAHQLTLRGHEVHVASLAALKPGIAGSDGNASLSSAPGLPSVMPFLNNDPDRRYPLPTHDPLARRSLQRLVDRVKPDVVHSHGWSTLTALHLDVPLVATLHDSGLFCPKRTLLRSGTLCEEGPGLRCILSARAEYGLAKSAGIYAAMRLNQASLPRADCYIAVSTFVRDVYLRHTSICTGQISVIPNFYREDAEDAREGTREVGKEDERGEAGSARASMVGLSLPPKYVLFVGYLARYKGAHVLLEAYRRLRTDVPLVMIGYPTEQIAVSDPRVRVIEGAPHAEVMRALEHCLFAVVPSIVPDSLPTVALEAMSRGKALVGSRIGGLPDVIEPGQTGFLVPPGDPDPLAARMSELLDDPSLAERLGQAGLRRLQAEFSADVVVPRIEQVYRLVAQ